MKLNETELETLHLIVAEVQDEMKSWRKGQTYFNVLAKLHPELAEQVRASKIDPFFIDERLPEFFKFISDEFNDSEIL